MRFFLIFNASAGYLSSRTDKFLLNISVSTLSLLLSHATRFQAMDHFLYGSLIGYHVFHDVQEYFLTEFCGFRPVTDFKMTVKLLENDSQISKIIDPIHN